MSSPPSLSALTPWALERVSPAQISGGPRTPLAGGVLASHSILVRAVGPGQSVGRPAGRQAWGCPCSALLPAPLQPPRAPRVPGYGESGLSLLLFM